MHLCILSSKENICSLFFFVAFPDIMSSALYLVCRRRGGDILSSMDPTKFLELDNLLNISGFRCSIVQFSSISYATHL